VIFAAVGPSAYVPHVFHNTHAEHFAAFYALAFLAAVGLPRVKLAAIVAGLALLAAVLAAARLTIPAHRMSAAEDLLADVAGALAALAPILAGRFRELAAQTRRDGA
jgi:VanZ family protein